MVKSHVPPAAALNASVWSDENGQKGGDDHGKGHGEVMERMMC